MEKREMERGGELPSLIHKRAPLKIAKMPESLQPTFSGPIVLSGLTQ